MQSTFHRREGGRSPTGLYRRAWRMAAALLAAAGLSGCQSMSMNSAQLRVIDASSNTGTVDSYQDNAGLAYNLDYGTMTSYVSLTPGGSTLAVDRVGTRQMLASSKAALVAGKQYTEILSGSLVNLQQTVLMDQSNAAPAGEIAIRWIDEAERSGAVDIYLVPSNGKLANLSPIVSNLSFGTSAGYVEVPDGTYAVDVLPAGATPSSSAARLLSGSQVEYASGSVRTIVLIDQAIPDAAHAPHPAGIQAMIADDADAQ